MEGGLNECRFDTGITQLVVVLCLAYLMWIQITTVSSRIWWRCVRLVSYMNSILATPAIPSTTTVQYERGQEDLRRRLRRRVSLRNASPVPLPTVTLSQILMSQPFADYTASPTCKCSYTSTGTPATGSARNWWSAGSGACPALVCHCFAEPSIETSVTQGTGLAPPRTLHIYAILVPHHESRQRFWAVGRTMEF